MRLLILILLCGMAMPMGAQEITVAAAADLHSVMDEISSHFQSEKSVRVKVSYGSSGNFYQQLQNGAPFDIFFSANTDYPKRLEAAGLVVPGTYYEYARGKIVLLTLPTSTLDLKHGLKVLLEPSVNKIAVADPSHAPYGQAAIAALKFEGIYDKVSARLVTAENISQATSFVLSGAADIGIVALSLAVTPAAQGQARFVEISSDKYPPLMQACVVLKSSKQEKLARQFESYIRGTEARSLLKKYGFEPPSPDAKKLVP